MGDEAFNEDEIEEYRQYMYETNGRISLTRWRKDNDKAEKDDLVLMAQEELVSEIQLTHDMITKYEQTLVDQVIAARNAGIKWVDIGRVFGLSRQACRQKFVRLGLVSEVSIHTKRYND